MTDLLPILHVIDVAHDIDMKLIARREGRAARQTRSRKGWATRRERIAARSDETPFGGSAEGKSRAEGLAQ